MTTVELKTTKILAEIRGGVGWLTINQPERRNAVSLEMWDGIADAAETFEQRSDVRVVVMHGAGGKAFASGADISEFEKSRANAEQQVRYGVVSSRGRKALQSLTKPLIAMIEGFCVGGGLAIALTADIRFATPDSKFAIPAAKLGLGYEYEGLAALARLVGPSTAKDMLFSGRKLDADEALRVGLINQIVASDALQAFVSDYAGIVAGNAPLTVHAAKAAIRVFEKYSADPESSEVAKLVVRCFDSADYQEGRRAFMEKRKPQFQGK
ncbi:enoyl-CoA hydratase [Ferrovibrio xuzhouensis]|uniref:Enoyl-CoA hydratase n=1 Tax=Ferrovibrio xuzhouensis TaxID=1576914 RepID=A0ABV7VNG6_9PROT